MSPAPSSTPQPEAGEEAEALEADADAAASAALARASKPAGTDGLEFRRARTAVALLRGEAGPRLRSGLRIHRCPGPSAPVRSPTQGVTAPPATTPTAAPGNSCGGPSQAQAYVPTEEGAIQPELKPDEFGKTSKLGAYFTFGACLVGGEWRFQLTSLRVPITSAVRPPDFRIEVGSAADSAVTRDSFAKITSDLSPTRHVSAEVTCGYDTWTDDVTTYSRRRTYWKRQLVVNHEAFHRQDWDTIYRKHLIEAEANVWAYRAPADIAASPAAAVAHERKALDDLMAAAYRPTCQEYTPHQESRAYDAGAPAYQTLVDDIRRRATAEKWT